MAAPGPWSNRDDPGDRDGRRFRSGRPIWPWMVFGGASVVVSIVALMHAFPGDLDSGDNRASLLRSLLPLGVIGAGALLQWARQPKKALRDAGIWAMIIAVLVLGYGVRREAGLLLDRIAGDVDPSTARMTDAGLVIGESGGHFRVAARVNGVPVRFLVDTGASDVILTQRDAERLGYDLSALRFTRVYATANGAVSGAPIRLADVRIGDLVVSGVRASVSGGELASSLLGMSYLRRLRSYTVEGDWLILRP